MARILLGVTGGIAAYKALETARLAVKAGHAVRVIQTPASQHFVGAASFAAITGAPVLTSETERDPARGAFPGQDAPLHDPASHLELVRNADVYLVAPATANTIAKLAQGMADNLLTSAALAARCPVLVAPAMNDAMWEHAATRANVATLAARGITIVDPGTGQLGTLGEWGVGRLAEPPQLLAAVELAIASSSTAGVHGSGPWDGRRVLVTAGGTREPIDAVRFVGNRSSGRMGFALAAAAAALGADVTVVAANVALPRDPAIRYVDVVTAAELHEACATEFPECHVLLMTAAVADFRPVDAATVKLKKAGRDELTIRMEATPDVHTALAAARTPGQTLVGFAAETGDGAVAYGRDKLTRKGLDAVVVNDVARPGIGFDTPDNEVTIVTGAGEEHVARAGKDAIAAAILRTVDTLRASSADPTVA
jgi:phosphopantothenoylcysteine decarboxylase/phosphopantothenate--cysteine ligase